MQHIGRLDLCDHVSLTPGQIQARLREALGHYLGFEVAMSQGE